MGRTVKCTPATRQGRTRKTLQFAGAAEVVSELADDADDADDVADAYVTLLVHAGIAAADVLCCAALGEHAVGENHNDAVTLLTRVDQTMAGDLRTLLGLKTKAGYGHQSISQKDRVKATRACERLVQAVRDLPSV